MFTVRSLTTGNSWNVNSEEELVHDLKTLNLKCIDNNTSDELIIYETNEKGDILNNEKLILPTTEANILKFLKEEDTEVYYENDVKKPVYKETEDYSEEDLAVLNSMKEKNEEDSVNNAKTKREEIRRQLELKRQKEEFLNSTKEENIFDEQEEIEEVEEIEDIVEPTIKYVEKPLIKINREQYEKSKRAKVEYQAPVEFNNNQTVIYENRTVKSVFDMKEQFKIQVQAERKKIEDQIILLERELRNYDKLISAMDSID